MLLVHPQAGEKIADGERDDQADDRGDEGQQQTAREHRAVAADGEQVVQGKIAVAVRQGIIHHDDEGHHREERHPHEVGIRELSIVNLHHFGSPLTNAP